MPRPATATALLFALLASCQHSENRYLDRTVGRDELVGRWQITPTGIAGAEAAWKLPPSELQQHFIQLNFDGTCEIRAFEDFMKSGRIRQTPCSWRLGDDGQHQQLRIESPSEEGRWFFYFDEEDGTLLLWIYTLDPDQWEYYEFAKVARRGLTRPLQPTTTAPQAA